MKNRNQFYKNAVYFITGGQDNFQVTGDPSRVAAVKDVLLCSRSLYEALESKSSTLTEILELSHKKKQAGKRYEKIFGDKWLL